MSDNKIHINRPMTNISVAYIQDADKFVANKIFPEIPVEKESASYFIYDSKQYLRDDVKKVAPGGNAPSIELTVKSKDAYICESWELQTKIPIAHQVNADEPLNIQIDTTELLTRKSLINREINFARTFMRTGCWETNFKGGKENKEDNIIQWDQRTAAPIDNIDDWKELVYLKTGFEPNTLVLSKPAWRKLKKNTELLSRILYKGGDDPAIVTRQTIAAIFELDNIYIMDAIYNQGKEGDTTTPNEYISGKSALLCYVPESPGLKTPASGYTFAWTGLQKQLNGNREFDRIGNGSFCTEMWWDINCKSHIVRTSDARDQRLVGKELGVFIDNIVS
ncbi:hypothetical protein [Silvanigrella sp.]|jgi:hypothetical protein|uniref:hypothetical protein n=1 Tax=Silvanigrella sp. TaxID=2024976 RepID=UPI0037CBD81D